jgi:tetratricopeptide (TPR) repeat protein
MRVLFLTTVLLLPCVDAQPPKTASSVTRVDDVLRKATVAMGGLDRIHAIHSLVFRGFHFEGSYKQEYAGSKTSNATLIRMRPNLRLVGCRPEVPGCAGKWGNIIETFDGEHGWELNWPKQRLVHTVNKAEQALRCGAEFDPLFVDYKQRGFQAAYLGRKRVLNTDAEAVQIDQQGCSSAIYYFDPKNYELLMTQLTIPIHARGDFIPTVAVYKAFKMVEGVRVPSRSEEVNLTTGEVLGGAEWTSIEANTLQDAAIFKAPVVTPTGVTAAVLKMLQASDVVSPEEMMAIYFQFRAGGTTAPAERVYDMNWLGYELLKADKYGHAIIVFRQILDENPDLASAYESLGEAYLQQHDRASAIDAFQQAVNHGLKSGDVAKKLAQLRSQ